MNLLIRLLIGVLILGLVWFLLGLIPLGGPFILIARIVVIVIAIVWLVQTSGVFSGKPLA